MYVILFYAICYKLLNWNEKNYLVYGNTCMIFYADFKFTVYVGKVVKAKKNKIKIKMLFISKLYVQIKFVDSVYVTIYTSDVEFSLNLLYIFYSIFLILLPHVMLWIFMFFLNK